MGPLAVSRHSTHPMPDPRKKSLNERDICTNYIVRAQNIAALRHVTRPLVVKFFDASSASVWA
jgi:hypothetical protein